MRVSQSPRQAEAIVPRSLQFSINVAQIRALTTTSNSTITVRSRNPRRINTLNLGVVPNFENGFTQDPICRNRQTGNIVNVNDPVDCELALSDPPTTGQLITYEVEDRLCVSGNGYSSNSGIGTITFTGNGTAFNLPLRALGGTRSDGNPCASETGVQHTVNFWVGQKSATAPDATANFRIRSLQ